jgi:UDP-N-acetylmuramoylalanine--D-glutamate ligase
MKKVTVVLGMGVSGTAAAEFLLGQGASVLGIDRDPAANDIEIRRLQALGLSMQHESCPIEWEGVLRLVVSPGISPKHPIYRGALEHGVPVIGEAELALPFFTKPLLGITGTNGKTTVTLLATHVLQCCGIRAKALGNVGTPLCSELISPGDEEVYVVELSSFQLETMRTPVFDAGVILNITPDHLDRYADMQEYAGAKCRLQHLMKKGAPFFVQKQAAFDYRGVFGGSDLLTFGVGEGADLWTGKSEIVFREKVEAILPNHYREMGRHESENALAVWALCRSFSVSGEQFCRTLATFQKPRHRIEFVRELDGVFWYDDSKGTNIDAVIQAVGAMKGPVVLIAGGVDKGASYLPWKEAFAGRVRQIIVIGEAAPKMTRELSPWFNIAGADSLAEAVKIAASLAKRGDSVLLSPGCSSYDMFRDYAHRGEEFQHQVQTLE